MLLRHKNHALPYLSKFTLQIKACIDLPSKENATMHMFLFQLVSLRKACNIQMIGEYYFH